MYYLLKWIKFSVLKNGKKCWKSPGIFVSPEKWEPWKCQNIKDMSKMSISMIVVFLFLQENDGEIIRKRTKRSWEHNHRTIARDTRGPDEITQKDLDKVADYSTGKVYNQVTVCILARAVVYWVKHTCAKDDNGVNVNILR